MTKVVIIADDLTGANANCSLMKKVGLSSASLLSVEDEIPKNMEVIAYTTNSRALSKEEAHKKVSDGLKKLKHKDVMLYSKRIDSTLRGNLGSELNAFLEELDGYMGICVPSYPDSERIVINGTMLVNGNLLLNTDAGKDTKTPVFSNDVKELIKKDFNYEIKSVFLEEIEEGIDKVTNIIKEEKKKGTKLLVFDGVSNEHLEIIAKASVKSCEKLFAVDPGPFTKVLTEELLLQKGKGNKVLMIVGSVTDISIEQIKEVIFKYNVKVIDIDPMYLIIDKNLEEYARKISKRADEIYNKSEVLLITTTPYKESQKRLNLKEISEEYNISLDDISKKISRGLAYIGLEILKTKHNFQGVFSSGGDITVALTEEINAFGIEIREEIIPLVAYGRIMGGLFPNLRIVSKGGMVGEKDAMAICVNKLIN